MTRLKVRRGPRAPMVTVAEIASWQNLCPPCAVEYHRWATHVFPPVRRYISNTPQLTRMNYGAEKEKTARDPFPLFAVGQSQLRRAASPAWPRI